MGIFNFFKKKDKQKEVKQSGSGRQERDEFTQDMMKSADYFVSRNSERFSGLDYSVESLEIVDNILDEAADFYEEMNEEKKTAIIGTAGSYIFEVARRNFGGKYFWYDHLNQPIFVTGQPEFEASILAFDKVRGRLENGKEDNITFYFAGYIERVSSKQSGMIV